jgi:thiamine biosynthesis lipoprotein
MFRITNISQQVSKITRLMFFYGLLLVPITSLTANLVHAQALNRYKFNSVQMGGPWEITLFALKEEQAKHASELAFKRVAEINQLFSDYSDSSELNKLVTGYQVNKPIQVSAEFFKLTKISREYAHESAGAFDISVGPLTQLWRRAYRKKQLPSAENWQEAHAKVGDNKYSLNSCEQTITFKMAGMKLDFGAIAKGYAADEALKVLQEHGFKSALVDGNGNFAAGDPPPDKDFWTIELFQLQESNHNTLNQPPPDKMLVKLKNQGVSTSGDYSQSIIIDGHRYSHIIDPITGRPQTGKRLITVIACDGMTADALSTILCIQGESFIKVIQEKHPGTEVYGTILINNAINTFSTDNWKKLIIK